MIMEPTFSRIGIASSDISATPESNKTVSDKLITMPLSDIKEFISFVKPRLFINVSSSSKIRAISLFLSTISEVGFNISLPDSKLRPPEKIETAVSKECTNLTIFSSCIDENEHNMMKKQRRIRTNPVYIICQPSLLELSLPAWLIFLRFLLIYLFPCFVCSKSFSCFG